MQTEAAPETFARELKETAYGQSCCADSRTASQACFLGCCLDTENCENMKNDSLASNTRRGQERFSLTIS